MSAAQAVLSNQDTSCGIGPPAMSEYPDGLIDTLVALNELLAAEEGLEPTLGRVATIACRALPECSTAGVTLERPSGPRTVAHCGDVALTLDEAQYAERAGPCLDAFLHNEIIHVRPISEGPPAWAEFVRVADEVGIHSSLSLPLLAGGLPIGALNLYSEHDRGFSHDHVELAHLFSQQAAVAIANAEVYWRTYTLTENLRTALGNRDVIGQAKGVLMAQRRINADAAFDALRRTSQRSNRKLVDIADHVVRTGELPPDIGGH